MPRPKTITDEAILVVAEKCFREHGHTVSTRDIARAAGISQAVLYQRFGGKKELFLRAMMPKPPNIEALLGSPKGRDARTYIQEVMRSLVTHFHRLVPAIMHLTTYPGFEMSQLSSAHEHLLAKRLHDELAQRLRTLSDTGAIVHHPPEFLASTIIALAHSAAMHFALESVSTDAGLQATIDAMFEVVWSGLRPSDEAPST